MTEPVVERLEIRRAHNGWIIKQVGWVRRDTPGLVDDEDDVLEERTIIAGDVGQLLETLKRMAWPTKWKPTSTWRKS